MHSPGILSLPQINAGIKTLFLSSKYQGEKNKEKAQLINWDCIFYFFFRVFFLLLLSVNESLLEFNLGRNINAPN